MQTLTEQNKKTVIRFNKEIIENGSIQSFKELVADDVINHAAPLGSPNGPDSMIYFIFEVLRKGFPDVTVDIFDQVAEGDKVTTRKTLSGTQTGEFMGIPPSNKKVTFNVIDIIRLRDGRYAEHWGISNIPDVIAQISAK